MSHFTEIKTQIKDIEALRLACQELGLPLLQNSEARGYYENKTVTVQVLRQHIGVGGCTQTELSEGRSPLEIAWN